MAQIGTFRIETCDLSIYRRTSGVTCRAVQPVEGSTWGESAEEAAIELDEPMDGPDGLTTRSVTEMSCSEPGTRPKRGWPDIWV